MINVVSKKNKKTPSCDIWNRLWDAGSVFKTNSFLIPEDSSYWMSAIKICSAHQFLFLAKSVFFPPPPWNLFSDWKHIQYICVWIVCMWLLAFRELRTSFLGLYPKEITPFNGKCIIMQCRSRDRVGKKHFWDRFNDKPIRLYTGGHRERDNLMPVRRMRGIRLKGHRTRTEGEGGREDRGRKGGINTGKTGKNKKNKPNEDKHTLQTGPDIITDNPDEI